MMAELMLRRFGTDTGLNEIEGYTVGSDSSVIIVNLPPGEGPALHRHPYSETLLFQIDDKEIEASAGSLVVIPANAIHGFKSLGPGRLKQVDIHASDRFVTDWV
jgi:quercetin dioxygenase-like cupin family protein